MIPAFYLVLMMGHYPAGDVALYAFPDREKCVEAAQAVMAMPGPIRMFCYDTEKGEAVDRFER